MITSRETQVKDRNDTARKYQRKMRASEQDVLTSGDGRYATTEIKNTARRKRCRANLKSFLKSYLPEPFYLGFSKEHDRLIKLTQQVILESGQMVVCLPRGSGKTTILVRAVIWASLYGHCKFPILATADDGQFKRLMEAIQTILETSPKLREDFPEVIEPILALERVPHRCRYQTFEGEPTHIMWSSHMLRFATTSLSKQRGNAGIVIGGGGITGAIRGMTVALPDGSQIRPDCLLIDDIQTRQSAKSPSQVQERIDTLNGDLLRMSGAAKSISALCACTVIYENDAAEKLLDNELSPNWEPIRVPTLYAMPTNMDLWAEYDGIRRQELLSEVETGSANKFYKRNRKKLDEGAKHYWPERVDPRCLSAIQTAMEDYFSDPRTFMAECQNQPDPIIESELEQLNASVLAKRMGPFPENVIPPDASCVTCYIDVQQECLFYCVTAFNPQFGGNVITYGSWPDQPNRYFTLKTIVRTAKKRYKATDDESAIRACIVDLLSKLEAVNYWDPEGSRNYKIDRILIDGRWKPEVVEKAIIDSESSITMPALGYGIGAKRQPMSTWKKRPGAKRGEHWQVHKPELRIRPAVHVDSNFWKNEAHTALIVETTHDHAVKLFKHHYQSHHQLFADHCVSEIASRVEANGRIVDEWDLKHSTMDNHLWDCFVGTLVAASTLGTSKETHARQNTRKVVRKGRVSKLKV